MIEAITDYIKDLLADLIRWLTRNEGYMQMLATNRTALGGPIKRVRFILALVAQCPLSMRGSYKRIQRGQVKGTWFAKDARKKTEQDFASGSGPVVFFIHGGAFLSGNTKMWSIWSNKMIDIYKSQTGKNLSLFFVDYTLAPEAHFPTQWNQCTAAYKYLTSQLAINQSRVFIAGDSAGANLALQTTFELPNSKSLGGSLLFSPWGYPAMSLIADKLVVDTHNRMVTEKSSWYLNFESDYITESFGGQGVQAYVGKSMSFQEAYDNPQINPYLRTEKEIANLPPVLCIYGDGECLRDQITEWVDKVKRTEHDITAICHPEGVHDWALNPRYAREPGDFENTIMYTCKWIEKNMK